MNDQQVLSDLIALVGGDVALAPDATSLDRHTHDYCVHGRKDVGVIALVFPRNTQQVSAVLRDCNEHVIAVQPQGGHLPNPGRRPGARRRSPGAALAETGGERTR